MKLAVVGATGLVGRTMLKVLEERKFAVSELIAVASEKSVGKTVVFGGKEYKVLSPEDGVAAKADIALFSAGASVSREWAPKFAQTGCIVVDNSSCWRMDPDVRLIIPEINGSLLSKESFDTVKGRIIANPNCSTIQMLMALAPLHYKYGIKRIVVSTYQSITGTGAKAVNRMDFERNPEKYSVEPASPYPYQIDLNILPHIDVFLENGYTKEEQKMVDETHKIMDDYGIGVSATTVRVPVMGGHSESVNVEFAKDFDLEELRQELNSFPGVEVQDDPNHQRSDAYPYPMPLFCCGSDKVFVGRLRRDFSAPNCLNMWVVSDNLRKGAATNAVQIAELIALRK